MSTAAALVAIITAANGTADFPARINTTAAALGGAAERRFTDNGNLLALCRVLNADSLVGSYGIDDEESEGFTDEDAAILSFFLATNTKITRFHPDHNTIGDAGAAAIAEALKTNTALTHLFLGDNQIGAAGATAIAGALTTNTVLGNLRSVERPPRLGRP